MAASVFGWELLLDLHGCDRGKISSREWIEKFAIEVCECLKMKRFGDPIIEHFGHDDIKTAGYSLVQLIETSSIVAHFGEYYATAYLDIFSCKEYDAETVTQFTKEFFGAERVVHRMVERV